MAQRHNRNGIPPVNQNPRPPNEPRYGLAGNQPAGSNVNLAGNKAVGGGNKKKQGNKGNNNNAGGGGNAALTSASPASGSFAAPVDPRDSQYWRDMAQLNFNKDVANRRFATEEVTDKTQYEGDIANRNYLDPIEVRRNREAANVGGIIYSTAHQEDLGNLAQQQFVTREGISNAYQAAMRKRAGEKYNVAQEYEIGEKGALSEGSERASNAELERPGPYVEPPESTTTKEIIRERAGGNKKKKKKK